MADDKSGGNVKVGVVIRQVKEGYQPKQKVEKGFQPKPGGEGSTPGRPPSGGSNVTPAKGSGSKKD